MKPSVCKQMDISDLSPKKRHELNRGIQCLRKRIPLFRMFDGLFTECFVGKFLSPVQRWCLFQAVFAHPVARANYLWEFYWGRESIKVLFVFRNFTDVNCKMFDKCMLENIEKACSLDSVKTYALGIHSKGKPLQALAKFYISKYGFLRQTIEPPVEQLDCIFEKPPIKKICMHLILDQYERFGEEWLLEFKSDEVLKYGVYPEDDYGLRIRIFGNSHLRNSRIGNLIFGKLNSATTLMCFKSFLPDSQDPDFVDADKVKWLLEKNIDSWTTIISACISYGLGSVVETRLEYIYAEFNKKSW